MTKCYGDEKNTKHLNDIQHHLHNKKTIMMTMEMEM